MEGEGKAMQKKLAIAVTLVLSVVGLVALTTPAPALADERIQARLRSFAEVPALSSAATGEFRGKISKDQGAIEYELSYEGLEGTVTQAHIHVAQSGVTGGISVWLCQSTTNPAPASVAAITPTCPPSGKVGGMLTEANVIGPVAQGIAPDESDRFAELLRAIRGGVAYANVHSKDAGGVPTNFNGGEIRGQLRASHFRFGHHD
jgi:hypothetical protein